MSSKSISGRTRARIDPVTDYARKVVAGKIVTGELVRLCCKRHLDDLIHGPSRGLHWSPKTAAYVCNFFKHLRHSKGEFANKPFDLSPWQVFRIGCAFGWLRADGTRRFRTAFNDVARKNGKTSEAAGIGLYGLLADGEEGSEVYSAATKKDQARLTFDEAKRMVRKSPGLRGLVQRLKLNMSVADTESKFEPLSSDAQTLDGLNPHFIIVDEFHKHKTRALFEVMDTAVGARRQPMMWIITTAGDDNTASPYAQERAYAENVLRGTQKDDSYFAYIATLDVATKPGQKGDDWKDEKNWIKGNPNLGVSVSLSDLRRQATKAIGSPASANSFKRLRLNVRTSSVVKPIPLEKWVLCTEGPIDLAKLKGRICYGGLDLSTKLDITAGALFFPPANPGERWVLYVRFWCPAENVAERDDRDKASYQLWIEEGWIEPTPGNIIDHSAAKNQFLEWSREFDLREVCYDPWNATQTVLELQGEGLVMKEFIQGIRSYTGPTKEFLSLVESQKLEHGGNPTLTWMAGNLATVPDKNLNMMPNKLKSTGRIDGMSAAIMALGAAIAAPEAYIYRDGNLLVI